MRFDEFVRNDTQVRLQDAKHIFDQKVKVLRELTVWPQAIESNLEDLQDSNSEVVTAVRELLSAYEAAREAVYEALSTHRELPEVKIEPATVIVQLTEASDAAKVAADELGSPEGIQKQLLGIAA